MAEVFAVTLWGIASCTLQQSWGHLFHKALQYMRVLYLYTVIHSKAYSWKMQQLFKFPWPKTTKLTRQPVFITSNSKSKNVLESFILPLTILLHTAVKIIIIVVMLMFWGSRVCSNLLSKEGTIPSRSNWMLGPPSKLYTKYIWVFFQQWIWILLQIGSYRTFKLPTSQAPLCYI